MPTAPLLATCIAVALSTLAQALEPVTTMFDPSIQCVGGNFGLRLPPTYQGLLKLGTVERQNVDEVEDFGSYKATRRTLYFDGLKLGVITFTNDAKRYGVTSAIVTGPSWQKLVPFKLGDSVGGTRAVLGALAKADPDLQSVYSGESDSIRFGVLDGKLIKIVYECFSG